MAGKYNELKYMTYCIGRKKQKMKKGVRTRMWSTCHAKQNIIIKTKHSWSARELAMHWTDKKSEGDYDSIFIIYYCIFIPFT
jgi:hypothetical protein